MLANASVHWSNNLSSLFATRLEELEIKLPAGGKANACWFTIQANLILTEFAKWR